MAGLPSVPEAGRIARVTDGAKGLRFSQGDRWLVPGPWVNVLGYGARGDGTTDDTTAIQDAIDDLPAGNGVIYLPAGTYLVDGLSHDDGVLYLGDGSGVSILKHADGQATPLVHVTGGTTGTPMPASPYYGFMGVTLRGGDSTTALIYYDGQIDNQVKFDDLQFIGGTCTTTDGISVRDYLNFNGRRIRWDHIGGWAIIVRDAQYFTHAHFALDGFSYDNQDNTAATAWGAGLFKLDTTSLTSHKGPVVFRNGRCEVNDKLTTAKPARALFRILQNHALLDLNTPQIVLVLEDLSIDVNAAAKDMKVVSCDYRDVILSVRDVNVFGCNEFFNNDAGDAKNATIAMTGSIVQYRQIIPDDQRFNEAFLQRVHKVLGMNVTHYSGDASRDTGYYKRGDFSYAVNPTNASGQTGRVFAYKAVQSRNGICRPTSLSLGTGDITSGQATLTMSSISGTTLPGIAVDVAGAGAAGGTLSAVIKSVDYDTLVVTLDTNASTTVSGAAVTVGAAVLAVVDMVFYGTAAPSTGTWALGDKVIHTAPSAAGNIGWVCTASGTPGTWVEFGRIHADQTANPDTSGATLGQLETEVNELKAALRNAGILST